MSFFRGRMFVRASIIGAATVLWPTVADAQTPFEVLHTFAGHSEPIFPADTPLIEGSDGNLYGISSSGGPSFLGSIFRVTKDGSALTTLHTFTFAESGFDHTGPVSLVRASDGSLYGMESTYSNTSLANLFRVAPNGTVTLTVVSPTPRSANGPSDGDGCV